MRIAATHLAVSIMMALSATCAAAAPDSDSAASSLVCIAKDGQSAYRIVLEPAASPSEKHAAQELKACFKACTGADLPILDSAPSDDAPMIVLGCGPIAARLGVDPPAQQLGEQGYVLRTVAPHLVIAGTPAAGTLEPCQSTTQTVTVEIAPTPQHP